MISHVLLTALVVSTATAHFNLDYPSARGFDEDLLSTFPCGSFNTPASNRTVWPITGGEIALTMGHIDANVEVFIGFGNDVGSAFDTVLKPVFTEQGLGAFCISGISLPDGANVTDGTNATIQVVTNGDPDGGLYNCADITFSSKAPGPADGVCKNGTGVTAIAATSTAQPNGTTSSSSTSSAGASSTAKSAANAISAGLGSLILMGGAVVAVLL